MKATKARKASSSRNVKAKRLRTVAGYRSLKRPNANLYDAAADVLEMKDMEANSAKQKLSGQP